MIRLMCDIKII